MLTARALGVWLALHALTPTGLHAQVSKPEREEVTGSNILILRPVDYRQVDRDEARRSLARVATCVYKHDPELVRRVLQHSDAEAIDYSGAGLTGANFGSKLGLESCLEFEALTGRIRLFVKPGVLPEMLTEPAYLAANPAPPDWLANSFTPQERVYVSTGAELLRAQGLAVVADCLVKAAPAQSDALLRTRVASSAEFAAARALAPALGGCLTKGQNLALNLIDIRAWAGSGLWQAYRGHAAAKELLN